MRYDLSALDAIERMMILDEIKESDISHQFDDGVLTVGRVDEASVDQIIATWEAWGEEQREFREHVDTAIEPDEIMVEIALPPMAARTGCAFLEVARRHGDYAMAGVAALVTLDENGVCQRARLVYLNLGDAPVDAQGAAALMIGEKQSDELVETVAIRAADEEIMPMGNLHASREYQQHLARVLTRRALLQAFEGSEQ